MTTTKHIKKQSCGILLYRYDTAGKVQVFLGKANSPRYWGRKYQNVWGIPKGQPDAGESTLETALREYKEEVGQEAPDLPYVKFVKYETPHNKCITVFIADATDVEVSYGDSMVHTVEWPANSGELVSYPELADARWFSKKDALKQIMWAQKGLLQIFFAVEKVKRQSQESRLVQY